MYNFSMKINEAKIRAEARRRGLNISAFANEIGIKRQLLYHYMKKGKTFFVAEKLASAIGLDPKDLIME